MSDNNDKSEVELNKKEENVTEETKKAQEEEEEIGKQIKSYYKLYWMQSVPNDVEIMKSSY